MITLSSGVEAKHSEVRSGNPATLQCVVTGLTEALQSVSWTTPNDDTITATGSGYTFDAGNYEDGSQTTTLTIDQTAATDETYMCVVSSTEHSKVDEETEVQSKVFSKWSDLLILPYLLSLITWVGSTHLIL